MLLKPLQEVLVNQLCSEVLHEFDIVDLALDLPWGDDIFRHADENALTYK
jgi:hypothetical protein